MAEVRDDLVPTDGLTNSFVRFAGLDTVKGSGAATLRFDIHDEDGDYLGTFPITVCVQTEGSIDSMVAEGHRQMKNVLRQWLHGMDVLHQAYSKRLAG